MITYFPYIFKEHLTEGKIGILSWNVFNYVCLIIPTSPNIAVYGLFYYLFINPKMKPTVFNLSWTELIFVVKR